MPAAGDCTCLNMYVERCTAHTGLAMPYVLQRKDAVKTGVPHTAPAGLALTTPHLLYADTPPPSPFHHCCSDAPRAAASRQAGCPRRRLQLWHHGLGAWVCWQGGRRHCVLPTTALLCTCTDGCCGVSMQYQPAVVEGGTLLPCTHCPDKLHMWQTRVWLKPERTAHNALSRPTPPHPSGPPSLSAGAVHGAHRVWRVALRGGV